MYHIFDDIMMQTYSSAPIQRDSDPKHSMKGGPHPPTAKSVAVLIQGCYLLL